MFKNGKKFDETLKNVDKNGKTFIKEKILGTVKKHLMKR